MARMPLLRWGAWVLLSKLTPTTLSTLREGTEAMLHTSLVVREDSLTLFGFPDADEKATFDILQGVSGVGPRLALGILAVHTPMRCVER